MKTAFYFEQGKAQIVLTPETKLEKALLGTLHEDGVEATVKGGSFYDCRGGWTRHGQPSEDDFSTMLILKNPSDD